MAPTAVQSQHRLDGDPFLVERQQTQLNIRSRARQYHSHVCHRRIGYRGFIATDALVSALCFQLRQRQSARTFGHCKCGHTLAARQFG